MISIKADVQRLTRGLNAIGQRQMPFATATALNDMAAAGATAVRRRMPNTFDRPVPFTMNAVTIQTANKSRLTARVFVKDRQAGYLDVQETGGAGRPKKTAFVIPEAIGVNQHGNMPRGALQRAKNRKGVFVGQVGKAAGFFFRAVGKAPVLLARFVRKATYKPRFGFRDRVTQTVKAVAPVALRQALAKAMATARR